MKLLSPSDLHEKGVKGHHPGSVLKILDGALRAIGEMGARRLSMRDISDASGVSRGTLYRYFSSREEVLAAVSAFVCVNLEDGVRAVRSEEHRTELQSIMRISYAAFFFN